MSEWKRASSKWEGDEKRAQIHQTSIKSNLVLSSSSFLCASAAVVLFNKKDDDGRKRERRERERGKFVLNKKHALKIFLRKNAGVYEYGSEKDEEKEELGPRISSLELSSDSIDGTRLKIIFCRVFCPIELELI